MDQTKAMADFTFVSKYAKYLKEEKRRETWEECVLRMKKMHSEKYVNKNIQNDIDEIFDAVEQKKILGSQRALQFSGPAIISKNARMYNCAGSYCDRLRFFQEAMYLLLCGTGVGFSVQKHHIAKLPKLAKQPKISQKIHTIEDSIEGWADALGVLLSSYFENPIYPEYEGCEVVFDYSLIRPEGSEFSHGIGRAPGPNGLRIALEKIRGLLDRAVASHADRIKPIEAYDIVMFASDAVLSGGIRRSATICLFSVDDYEMATAKTGNWHQTNPQRARSNNSAILLRNSTTREQFEQFKKWTREFGEPGFIWTNSLEFLFNPCVEIMFYCYDVNGQSGWQMCNLTTINGDKVRTAKDFIRYAVLASKLGTLQAGYDEFPYLGEVSENIIRREALIGVSITGMMTNPEVLLNPDIQREAANNVRHANKQMAAKIGINPAARSTCVKPEGSSTTILELVAFSGISAGKGKKVLRTIQMNRSEKPLQAFKSINPKSVEPSIWSANQTDDAVSFCCEAPENSIQEKNLGAINFLEHVRSTQNNWVQAGCNPELCSMPGMSHNVSNTVTVGAEEWDRVWDYVYDHRDDFAGISFLPKTGDKDYEQAPFVEVFSPTEIISLYGDGALFTSGLIEFAMHHCGGLWSACQAVQQGVNKDDPRKDEKEEFIRKVKNFSKKYLHNDTNKCVYLLKDIYNWKRWVDITNNTKPVDYSKYAEDYNTTAGSQEWACSGGACELK